MTALRSLLIQLGLDDRVSNQLRGIDTQLNGIESGAVKTQSGIRELEKTTKDYSQTSGRAINDVEKDIKKLNREVENHADVTKKATDEASKSWKELGIAGAAMTAAGAATTYMIMNSSKQAAEYESMSANFRRSVGENADAMLEEMDRAAAGTISSYDQIKQANYAMTMGIDVSTIPAMMEAARAASRRFGGDVSYYYESLVTGTARQSKLILDNLGIIIDAEKAYEEYAKSINKSVSALTDEERSLAFQVAVMKQSKIMVEETEMAYGEYNDELSRVSALTQDLTREISGTTIPIQLFLLETLTKVLDVFKDAPEPIKGLVGVFALLASGGLTTVGTLLTSAASGAYLFSAISTASLIPSLTAATASAWAFAAALLANPITWIVIGIVALVGALWYLSKNWDTVSAGFMDKWEKVSEVVRGALDWINNAWDKTIGYLVSGVEWLKEHMSILAFLFPVTAPVAAMNLLRDNWDNVVNSIGKGWDKLVESAQKGATWLKETIGEKFSGIIDIIKKYSPIGIIITQWKNIVNYLDNIDLIETGREIIRGLLSGILDIRSQIVDAIKGIGEDIVEGFKDFFEISSPSKLTEEMGFDIGEGFKLGLEKSMPESISLPEISPTDEELTYNTQVIEPIVETYTSAIKYESEILEPNIFPIEEELIYNAQIPEPIIEEPKPLDLEDSFSYVVEITEPELETNVSRKFKEIIDQIVKYHPLNIITKQWTEVIGYLKNIDLETLGQNIGFSLDSGIVATYRSLINTIQSIGKGIVETITGVFEIGSPSKLMQDIGISVGEGFSLGVSESMPKTIPLPEIPLIEDKKVIYESQITPIVVEDYTGSIKYENKILEPNISPITTEELVYDTQIKTLEIKEPEIPLLEGNIEYIPILNELDNLDQIGKVSYISEIAEPELETGIFDKFKKSIDQIAKYHPLSIITRQWNEVIEYLKNIDLRNLGQNIISSLVEGISSISQILVDTIKGIGEIIVSGITEFFEISSPSRLMQEIGSSIGEGFNLGINESIPKKITLPEFESISFEDSEPYEVTTEDISLTQKYVPEKETFRSSETNYNTFAPSTVINVTASNGDADAIATTIDRRIRQTFDQHAETYFARQRRRRSSTV